MFFHFDIPVYRPRWNWRTFKNFPDPKLYNPVMLDTDQWMEAAKAYGAKYTKARASATSISPVSPRSRRTLCGFP